MSGNPLEILRQWLCESGTTLQGLCGSRVYYPWIPDSEPGSQAFDNSAPGIVIVGLDGEPLAESVVTALDVEIRCFGGGQALRKDPRDAWTVYKALRERLATDDGQFVYGKALPAGRLLGVEETKTGTYEVEPVLNWPMVSSNWTVETAAT